MCPSLNQVNGQKPYTSTHPLVSDFFAMVNSSSTRNACKLGIVFVCSFSQRPQHWKMPRWVASLQMPHQPLPAPLRAPPQKSRGLWVSPRRCFQLTPRKKSKSMWIGFATASSRAPTAPIFSSTTAPWLTPTTQVCIFKNGRPNDEICVQVSA